MRLRDLWAHPPDLLTHREVINYVSCLPPDAVTLQLVLGDDAPWSLEMHRLTDLAELLERANWQRSAKPGSRPPTSRFRRPKPPGRDDDHDDDENDEDDAHDDADDEDVVEGVVVEDAPDGAPDGEEEHHAHDDVDEGVVAEDG